MKKALIDNFSDQELIDIAKESEFLSDFTKKIGYKNNNRIGKNSRKVIKERLDSIGISFSEIYSKKSDDTNNNSGLDGVDSLYNGIIGEHIFILECLKNKINVCKPINSSSVYDFIIDVNNHLLKVQVKTSTNTINNTAYFRLRDSNHNSYDISDVDYFFLYSLSREKAYLIKNNGIMKGIKIRFKRSHNNSNKCHYEDDCLFSKVIKEIYNDYK